MNNSYIALQNVSLSLEETDITPILRERETEIVKVIEAIREIKATKGWSTLKELVFDGLSESLRNELLSESQKNDPDTNKLNRISGQYQWARRYADLDVFEESLKTELTNVRMKLHGTTKENPG